MSLLVALASDTAQAFRTSLDSADPVGDGEPAVWRDHATHFRVHGEGIPGIPISAVADAAREAFDTWMAPACVSLSVSYLGLDLGPATPGDRVNTIQWLSSGWAQSGREEDAPAATDIEYQETEDGWEIVEADIYLNAERFRWTTGEPRENETSMLAVLTHEVGHFLGLLHPCEPDGSDGAPRCKSDNDFRLSALYPAYSASSTELSQDDRAGICSLYPAPDCEEVGCGEGRVCTKEGCLARCGEDTCPDGAWCENGRCVDEANAWWGEKCPCKDDDDCAEGQSCKDEVCQRARGTRALGDPCSDSQECASQSCHPDGYCTTTCAADTGCTKGLACEECDGASLCTASSDLGLFGQACEEGSNCVSGYCLSRAGGQSLCTRPCSPGGAACPDGWECGTVESRQVCRPPSYEVAGGGCGIAPRRPESLGWLLTALAGALSTRRIKRRWSKAAANRVRP